MFGMVGGVSLVRVPELRHAAHHSEHFFSRARLAAAPLTRVFMKPLFSILPWLIFLSLSPSLQAAGREEAGALAAGPRLAAKFGSDFKAGQPVFLRIIKDEAVLEVWMLPEKARKFKLFHSYPICAFSGGLGPKTREGDRRAPEGFYAVGLKHLNPFSNYHLSFDLGYPNAYDRARGYTGSLLMVHGNCRSDGCFAMTDQGIEEIYTLAKAALDQGQPFFRVHIFPGREHYKVI